MADIRTYALVHGPLLRPPRQDLDLLELHLLHVHAEVAGQGHDLLRPFRPWVVEDSVKGANSGLEGHGHGVDAVDDLALDVDDLVVSVLGVGVLALVGLVKVSELLVEDWATACELVEEHFDLKSRAWPVLQFKLEYFYDFFKRKRQVIFHVS